MGKTYVLARGANLWALIFYVIIITSRRPGATFTKMDYRLTPAWISDEMPSKVWDAITYPLPNLNSCTFEVWEGIENFILHFIRSVMIIILWLKLIPVNKMGPI